MRARRSIRVVTPLVAAALAAGALVAAPAHARKSKVITVRARSAPKACKAFKPVEPQSPSAERAEALEAEVVKLTDKATADKPVAIEFAQAPGLWADAETPIVEGSEFFNFQVVSKAATVELNLHVVWATPSASDIDEFLFSSSGTEVSSSVAFNPAPELNPSTGGEGFEHIAIGARRCDGYTLESRPFITPGENVTIHAWLD
jgi:hypothetical protein